MTTQTVQEISARDVLVAVFSSMAQKAGDGKYLFRGRNYEIQQQIFELQETGGRGLLRVFPFPNKGPDAFSPVLEESFLFVVCRNDYDNPAEFFIDDSARRKYKVQIDPALSASERAEVDIIASKLLERIPHRIAAR